MRSASIYTHCLVFDPDGVYNLLFRQITEFIFGVLLLLSNFIHTFLISSYGVIPVK